MRRLAAVALALGALGPAAAARADDQATVTSAFSALLPGSTARLTADPQGGREVVVTVPSAPKGPLESSDVNWRATLALQHAMETIPDLVSMGGPEEGAYVRLRLTPSDTAVPVERTLTQSDELARVNSRLDALRATFPQIEDAATAIVPLDTTPGTKAFAVGARIRVPDLTALREHFRELTNIDAGPVDSVAEVVDDAGHTIAVWLAGGVTIMWVDPAVGSTACDLGNHHPFGACPGETQVTRQPLGWVRPRRGDGFVPTKLTPDTRRIRIELLPRQCATPVRVRVHRGTDRITVTVVYRTYIGYLPDGCAYALRQVRTVGLHGRLGHRILVDGATSKPRY